LRAHSIVAQKVDRRNNRPDERGRSLKEWKVIGCVSYSPLVKF
jgi:hypothetical protein